MTQWGLNLYSVNHRLQTAPHNAHKAVLQQMLCAHNLLQDSLNEALRGELSRLQQHAATHGVTGGGQGGNGGAGAHMAELPGVQLRLCCERLHAPFPTFPVLPLLLQVLTAVPSVTPPFPVIHIAAL